MQLTPRQVLAWSLRALCLILMAALAFICAMAIQPVGQNHRLPVLMAFILLVGAAAVAGMGVLLGVCNIGSARAFSAGLRAGRDLALTDPPPANPSLRLVE